MHTINLKTLLRTSGFWYAVVALATIVSYSHIVNLLNEQFTVYTLHMGNPASYIFVFALFGWWFDGFYRRRWGKGKMGIVGYSLMGVGLVLLTVLLKYGFGYQFWF